MAALPGVFRSSTLKREDLECVVLKCWSNPPYKGCSRRLEGCSRRLHAAWSSAWIKTDLVEFHPFKAPYSPLKAPSKAPSACFKAPPMVLRSQLSFCTPRRLQAPWRRLGHCSSEALGCSFAPARYVSPKHYPATQS